MKPTTSLENRQVYGYKPDGNTVVLHRWKVHHVIGNLYLRETQTDQYNQIYAPLCVFLPDHKYGLHLCTVGRYDIEKADASEILRYANWSESKAEIENHFAEQINNEQWIKNSEIQFVRQFNSELADRMQEYHDLAAKKRYARNEEWKELARKRMAEEQAQRERETEKAIENAIITLREGQSLTNQEIHGKAIVNLLFDHFGIEVPLRTKGWINNSLASIQIPHDGVPSLYYRKHSKNAKSSETIWQLLVQLESAIAAIA